MRYRILQKIPSKREVGAYTVGMANQQDSAIGAGVRNINAVEWNLLTTVVMVLSLAITLGRDALKLVATAPRVSK